MLTLPRIKNSTGNLHPDFMRKLASSFALEAFVETGTYLGDTTANARAVFRVVHTIELSNTLAAKARQRFVGDPDIHVHCGDSATMLAEVVGQISGPTLFWLDGHYSEGVTAQGSQNTPIREELQIIAEKAPKGAIILIDDLRLFDEKASEAAAPASMHGYPTLNEIYADLSAMDYQLFVLGDVALAVPKTIGFEVSSLVQALTISRLYDGRNLEIEEVLDAEKVIMTCAGDERAVVIEMAAPYLATEQHGLGLHYRFWRALALLGQDKVVQAGQDLVETISKGFSHWRVRWYLAHILRDGGEAPVARGLVEEIVAAEPGFQAAHEFLRSLPGGPVSTASPKPLRPTLATDLPLVDQLIEASAYQRGVPLRLHLGCGEYHFPEYINIDYPPSEHTCQTQIGADVFGDITKLRLPAQGLHEIRLHHVFEHFQRSEALALLILWHEGLSIGGRLHIETPDVEGCARQLVSNIPLSMKQAVLRHCFGSQEAGWAIHYDGWTEAKYQHVLGKLGFAVQTVARSWPHPPHLANVEAVGTKIKNMTRDQLLAAADQLLAEYMVADVPSERTMCEVWRKTMREFLAARTPATTAPSVGAAASLAQKKKDEPDASDLRRIHGVVFSKDRAMQLDATLRSYFARCTDAAVVTLQVLYVASDATHRAHYQQLAHDYPQVRFIPERDFRADVFTLIKTSSAVLFIVDDNLFVQPFSITEAAAALAAHKDALGFSLRLGHNTTYCYPFDRAQRIPPFTSAGHGIVKFAWPAAELDFAYPLEVSSSLYRTGDLEPLLKTLDFKNPNTLEQILSEQASRFRESLPSLLCFERSVAFCNPVNKVQSVANNRAGTLDHYSAEAFARRFTQGERIDISAFAGYIPEACHEEAPIVFTNNILYAKIGVSNGATQSSKTIRASVIVTCYNYGKFLREAVRSVVNQTFEELEIIIVNDGSTDDSALIADSCVQEFKNRPIAVIHQVNSGQPALARNAGILQARGEFILPLDADDRIEVTYLQEAFNAIDRDPRIDLVYADSLFDDGKRVERKKPGAYDPKSLSRCNQLVYCCVYRRSLWESVGGYRDNVRGYEDWDFWLATSLTGARGAYVQTVGLLYNEKQSGVYSQTVAHHEVRCAQVMLNNPSAYTEAQLLAAREIVSAKGKLQSSQPSVASTRTGTLVSVVIPCFKQAEFLEETVHSVIAQTYPHWEILIVNDGSPDNTSAVAQNLILQNPTRAIRLIEKNNGGLSDARNAGISHARGEYILPLDADDKIHPAFLAKTVALLEKDPGTAIAYTDWLYFGAHNTLRHAIDYNFERLCTKENLFTCTSLYRKTAWTATGGYNTNMTKGLEDWDFWINCGKRGFTGKRIPEPLFFYRAKPGSMIHTVQPHVRTMFARIVLNHSDIYNAALVENARKTFEAANLSSPKPAAPGVEWQKSGTASADFQSTMDLAESAVRQQRFDEAIAHVEQALRLAPDAESIARASEIKNLLAELVPAPAAAANDGAPGDFFGDDEIKTIEQLVRSYSETPADHAVRAQIDDLQQSLMNFLVTAGAGTLESLFGGSFGRVFRSLVKCGLSSELPTEKSEAQLAVLDEALITPAGTFDLRPLLARMLCAPAHRGAALPPLDNIPSWLLDDYLGYLLHAPQVFVHEGEAERYHDFMLGCAREMLRRTRSQPGNALTLKIAAFFATKANYIPLYFSGRNTRELAEIRAAIMEFFLTKNGAAIDFTPAKRPKGRKKIKVGFVSAHFGAQTETHVTLPALQLDRTKFEICLFPVSANPGPIEDRCRSFADSFTQLSQNIHQQVKTLRDAALDIVIIGTNVTAVTNQVSLIALHRLAPVQLVNYCSPVTTGMRHIDGYLTGTFNDFPGIQDHFSERLRFCDGPPGCLDYTVENKTASTVFTRASLGLNEKDIVFVNAAACFKILPEMQETWAKILKAVPNSRLLLLPFNPNWSSAFPVKQFERTLTDACARHGVPRDRIVLAGSLPSRADVKALERVADVYLDTAPFSGSISVIDPLELGIPTAIWEGKTHRSRMAAALLRELKIPELIVQDEPSYIALSTKLAADPAYRRQISDRIRAAMAQKPTFINPQAYAQGLGILLESLVLGQEQSAPALAQT